MKIAYFDCQFGAAGDMLNAALIAAGVDEQMWRQQLAKVALPQGEFTVTVSDVSRCSIACKKVDVFNAHGERFDELPQQDRDREREREHSPAHADEPGHTHNHEPSSAEQHELGPERQHKPDLGHHHKPVPASHDHPHDHPHEHRSLQDILELIDRSAITDRAKALSSRIFQRLARAEAKVHGVAPADVHFHEVGAVDAVVDIVGFAIGYDMLGIEKSLASAVALGSGQVVTAHGLFPIPGPATVYLLQESGAAIAGSTIGYECLTPTGAAILCEIVSEWGRQPGFSRLLASGYGAGSKDPPGFPNACRVLIGSEERSSALSGAGGDFDTDTVAVLEANLDDLSPQALAYAVERLFVAGALDVAVMPAVMKKGRAGQLLTVLCHLENRQELEKTLLTQTSSLGLRWHEARRAVARREFRQIQLPPGEPIRIKLALDNQGKVINVQPEYDDCAAYATKHGVPLKEVTNQALAHYLGCHGLE